MVPSLGTSRNLINIVTCIHCYKHSACTVNCSCARDYSVNAQSQPAWIWSILDNGFLTNNLLDVCLEKLWQSLKNLQKKNKYKENFISLWLIGIICSYKKQGKSLVTYACRYSSGNLIVMIQSCQDEIIFPLEYLQV